MTGYPAGMPTFVGESYDDWCCWLFDGLADRGIWTVPRSGLVFEKHEAGRTFVLIDALPGYSHAEQDDDYRAIRDNFEHAGIRVRKGEK